MGVLANIKAIRDVQKIKSGGTASFTISSITNLIINLPDAKKSLDTATFDRVYSLFCQMNRCTNKMQLDYTGYITTAAEILKEFDKIAPCDSFIGLEPFEAMMVMKEVRNMF